MPKLGRLRELMLREARLLDSLCHDCVVPLERGWVEQRTGEKPADVCFPKCLSRKTKWTNYLDRESGPSIEEHQNVGCTVRSSYRYWDRAAERVCVRQPCCATAAVANNSDTVGSYTQCRSHGDGEPAWFSYDDDNVVGGEGDAAAFLLRSFVPLEVTEGGDDEDDSEQGDNGDRDESNSSTSNADMENGESKDPSWGGDDTTGWRGVAEPKYTAKGKAAECASATVTTTSLAAVRPFDNKRSSKTAEDGCCCSNCRAQEEADIDDSQIFAAQQQPTLCLASYLLLPDWLPLSMWFETEFEPRIAAPDKEMLVMGTVAAPEDWGRVWHHLLAMFLQVVRGVEYLHTQGVVHNNIHPGSIWVSSRHSLFFVCRMQNTSCSEERKVCKGLFIRPGIFAILGFLVRCSSTLFCFC